ncbi:hypothetical protein MNBD_GAMMA13-1178 [hydrothermal vent metagenome]|uniref:Uncharacterized protein n=1 Tax=hydrothermal vent metagenome TaxID=652676 RepID=A0A3B0Y1Y2_9ZZZZ
MTYIFDMADGTEHQGKEFTCPHPLKTQKHDTAKYHAEYQTELRLVEIEFTHPPAKSIIPASLDLSELIRSIED